MRLFCRLGFHDRYPTDTFVKIHDIPNTNEAMFGKVLEGTMTDRSLLDLTLAEGIAERDRRQALRAQGKPLTRTPGEDEHATPKFTTDTRAEKTVQAEIKRLLGTHEIEVYDTSQPFRAAITPGVPDLLCFCPRRGFFVVEVKSATGKQSAAQLHFQHLCERAGVRYILGGVAAVTAFLAKQTGQPASRADLSEP